MNELKILITKEFPEPMLAKLRAVSPRIVIEQVKLKGGKWPSDMQTDAEIIYATNELPAPAQAPKLRWVQAHFAGNDHLVETAVWQTDTLITNSSGVHAPNMGMYTITHILLWAYRVKQWFSYQQKSEWPSNKWDEFLLTELRGQTLGIVGYGQIGREVARLAKPFGLRIVATKRDPRHPEASGYCVPGHGDPDGSLPDMLYPSTATRSMVAECDYVINILPLTADTRHFFDKELFKVMKKTAVFINIGRGGSVDEPALIHALKKGEIAGASLDVFEQEPLPADSPLWQMENAILTPHIAGNTPNYDERVTDLFAENLRRYLNDEPLLNLINREKQY